MSLKEIARLLSFKIFLFMVATPFVLAACAPYRGLGDLHGPSPLPSAQEMTRPPESLRRAPEGPFHLNWPVNHVRVTQTFSPAKNPDHQGIDLGGQKGTPIFAAHEGLVVYAGRDFRGYGRMVLIEYDRQWATLYAHLTKILVKQGQYVKSGHTIGLMGRTGRATGVHLHFELLKDKQPIDPLDFLQAPSGIVSN